MTSKAEISSLNVLSFSSYKKKTKTKIRRAKYDDFPSYFLSIYIIVKIFLSRFPIFISYSWKMLHDDYLILYFLPHPYPLLVLPFSAFSQIETFAFLLLLSSTVTRRRDFVLELKMNNSNSKKQTFTFLIFHFLRNCIAFHC